MPSERTLASVLVVDDSATDRRLVGGLLQRAGGLAVEYAVDGKDAINRFQDSIPDLVVTDLIMPELDGLGLVAAIKSEFPLVPVILMTAAAMRKSPSPRFARGRPDMSQNASSRTTSCRRPNASWRPRAKIVRSRG